MKQPKKQPTSHSLPLAIAVLLASTAVSTSGAHAGGLFVPGLGTQAMGRGGAFTAKADDPSALFHNPAGFGKVVGTVVHLGANFIDYSLQFTRAGAYEDSPAGGLPYAGQPFATVEDQAKPDFGVGSMQALPLFAIGSDLGRAVPGLRVGVGVMVPNAYPARAMGADYQLEDPNAPPPPGRYDVVEQQAATVLPSIALAYSIGDRLDIGARFSFGFASLDAVSYTWALPNYEEWVATDSVFTLSAKDSFVPGYGVGVLLRPMDSLEIGASWSSALHLHTTGTGNAVLGSYAADPTGTGVQDQIVPEQLWDCAQGGEIGALSMCLDLTLPQTASAGARWILPGRRGERADIEFDLKWEDWSAASDYQIRVNGKSNETGRIINLGVIRHGMKDVLSARLGGSYNLDLGNEHTLGLRAGVAYDTAAAPNEWQRADIDGAARTTLALGASYEIARVRVDLAGGMVLEPDRTVEPCQTTLGNEDCPAGTAAADPVQPIVRDDQRAHSPINSGAYSSGYLMLSAGVTTRF